MAIENHEEHEDGVAEEDDKSEDGGDLAASENGHFLPEDSEVDDATER